jgi:hypothetical protein
VKRPGHREERIRGGARTTVRNSGELGGLFRPRIPHTTFQSSAPSPSGSPWPYRQPRRESPTAAISLAARRPSGDRAEGRVEGNGEEGRRPRTYTHGAPRGRCTGAEITGELRGVRAVRSPRGGRARRDGPTDQRKGERSECGGDRRVGPTRKRAKDSGRGWATGQWARIISGSRAAKARAKGGCPVGPSCQRAAGMELGCGGGNPVAGPNLVFLAHIRFYSFSFSFLVILLLFDIKFQN